MTEPRGKGHFKDGPRKKRTKKPIQIRINIGNSQRTKDPRKSKTLKEVCQELGWGGGLTAAGAEE